MEKCLGDVGVTAARDFVEMFLGAWVAFVDLAAVLEWGEVVQRSVDHMERDARLLKVSRGFVVVGDDPAFGEKAVAF